ncbi:MAG: HK97 family phage prohead protease [Candidatus Thiodiazotropha lotti]|nr:HK97 family phage prohead protease [Candidatus Thiodiazotropha lotti]
MERRIAIELRMPSPGLLVGYAAVFDAQSRDLGGFTESVRSGAFTRSLSNADHICALYDHDGKSVLGRVGAGTLKLEEDRRGLRFEIQLPPTSVGKDLAALVERQDVAGASFAFTVPKGGDTWHREGRALHRELREVNLHEITVTANPAYPDTTVAKRHIPARHPRLNVALCYLETVE